MTRMGLPLSVGSDTGKRSTLVLRYWHTKDSKTNGIRKYGSVGETSHTSCVAHT